MQTQYQQLMEAARQAVKFAYAPYTNFAVGAALLTIDGTIFSGCNVENASYSNGVCAERTAAVKAISQGYKEFQALAIFGASSPACWPCGVCRQFLIEFSPQIEIIVEKEDKSIAIMKLHDLLPNHFGPHNLKSSA